MYYMYILSLDADRSSAGTGPGRDVNNNLPDTMFKKTAV